MQGKGLVKLLAAAAVAVMAATSVSVADAECSFCRYAAWNCSTEAAALAADGSVAETSVQGELRKETKTAEPEAVAVCDAQGKIQVDDVFCDGSDCSCVDGKSCVSMQVGCKNLFQARSRKRCVGDSAIQRRFQQCAGQQALTLQPKANLEADWVFFNQPKRCNTTDCRAVRRFSTAKAVVCGYLVVAWKEGASQYRFVVDGSRASDMEAGTFLFKMDSSDVSKITSTKIQDCYGLQTRNEKNGTCNGFYMQLNTNAQSFSGTYNLSSLDWPTYIAVVGSVIAAVGSVAAVALVVRRHRREQAEDELSELLPEELQSDCKTPDLNDNVHHDASSPPVRQRVLSPRSLGSSQ